MQAASLSLGGGEKNECATRFTLSASLRGHSGCVAHVMYKKRAGKLGGGMRPVYPLSDRALGAGPVAR